MQTGAPTPSPAYRRAGRLVAYAVFLVLAFYVGGAIILSVWKSLYGAAPMGDAATRVQQAWCVRALGGLREELDSAVERALQTPKGATPAPERFLAWNADFTHRMEEAAHSCSQALGGPVEVAFEQLASLHASYAQGIEMILTARADVSPGLSEVVRSLSSQAEGR